MLADPRLTGMPRDELTALAEKLAPAQAAQREQRCYRQRGGRRRHAPGAHGRPVLTGLNRILVALLYLRQLFSQNVLSDLLGVTQPVIGQAVNETRLLLDDIGYALPPPRSASHDPRMFWNTWGPGLPRTVRMLRPCCPTRH
jgi:hypothetical protein